MYLYLIFTILAILGLWDIARKERSCNRPLRHFIFWGIILIFMLLSAMRWETGTDWQAYRNYFEDQGDWMEWGYTALSKISYSLYPHYSLQITLMAVMIFTLTPRIIERYSVYPFVTLLAFWTITIANIYPVRQTLAITLTLWSLQYIVNRRPAAFYLCILGAFLFHASALIFLAAYYLFHRQFSRGLLLTVFVGCYLLSFTMEEMISGLMQNINIDFIRNRIDAYISDGDQTFGMAYSVRQVLIRGFINNSLLVFLIYFVLEHKRREDPFFNGISNLFIFGIGLGAILTAISPALARLCIYFTIFQIFIFGYIFTLRLVPLSKLIVYSALTCYFLYRFYGVVNNYYDLYVPYKSILW